MQASKTTDIASGTPGSGAPAVEMRGIVKRFGPAAANDNVDFTLQQGEIHALLGENGAGKSTLMNCLFGMFKPDAGTIRIEGREVRLDSPAQALDTGIGMVHQHFMLVPNFSVAENVAFGSRSMLSPTFRSGAIVDEVQAVADSFGMGLDASTTVSELSIDIQQRVEIVKLLYRGAEILILDEPTAVLGPTEVDNLFTTLKTLASRGKSIVIITHKLSEIMDVADAVTVLRHGQVAATVSRGEFDEKSLAVAMIGHSLPSIPEHTERAREERGVMQVTGLSVEAANTRAAVHDVSFSLHEGEILGVVGVEGNGQVELLQALCGAREAVAGEIVVEGSDLSDGSPADFYAAGVGVITEDRLTWDLIPEMSVADNIALSLIRIGEYSNHGLLDKKRIHDDARQLLEAYDVRPADPDALAGSLSGGNQQKVVLAREISRNPKVLLASQPTRGLDVGATDFVFRQLAALRDGGGAVILNSSELDELLKIADRVMVLYRGAVVLEGRSSELEVDQVAAAMTGANGAGRTP